jgi:hypothetical protein
MTSALRFISSALRSQQKKLPLLHSVYHPFSAPKIACPKTSSTEVQRVNLCPISPFTSTHWLSFLSSFISLIIPQGSRHLLSSPKIRSQSFPPSKTAKMSCNMPIDSSPLMVSEESIDIGPEIRTSSPDIAQEPQEAREEDQKPHTEHSKYTQPTYRDENELGSEPAEELPTPQSLFVSEDDSDKKASWSKLRK